MPIFVDHQLQEQIPRDIFDFPIAFYCDELADLPNRAGPMHWHPCFEIATAQNGVLDYQVGQTHTILEPGDSIFVNPNMLHGIRQVSNWKQAVSTIFDDAAKDKTILEQLYHMRNRVYGRSRLLFGDSPSAKNQPLKIAEGLFFESKFDAESLLNVLAERIFKPTGYDFGAIRLRIIVE